MTHLITDWPVPHRVHALQTSNTCGSVTDFDVHPAHNPLLNQQLSLAGFAIPAPVNLLKQVHGDQVVEYPQSTSQTASLEADACFTRQAGIVCAVMTADCLPVLLTDDRGGFVAAVHCGWRSLYAGILARVIEAVKPEHQVLAWLGPCIQQLQYEVTTAFRDHYLDQHPEASEAFTTVVNGHCQASLSTMAKHQLSALNITRISEDQRCTHSDDNLYSWRRNQTTKRLASMIWMTQPEGQ
jgi:YfiH family protein